MMRLNQVTLPVPDMAISTAFYRKMGFLQIVDLRITLASLALRAATFSLALQEDAGTNNAFVRT